MITIATRLGQLSSIAKHVLESTGATLPKTGDQKQRLAYDHVTEVVSGKDMTRTTSIARARAR